MVSFVIPVYKVEKDPNGCVKGMMGKTYPHLEIFMVNNGFTENCLQMCDEWTNRMIGSVYCAIRKYI